MSDHWDGVVHIGPGGIFENFVNLAQSRRRLGDLIFAHEAKIAEMNVSEAASTNAFQFLSKHSL